MVLEKKSVDQIFMVLFGVIGIILFGLSANSFDQMSSSCTTPIIYDGMVTVLIMGAVLVTMAIGYLFCNWMGGECYNKEGADGVSEIYIGVSCGLSLILTLLLLVMGVKLGQSTDCASTALKTNIWFMFVMCLILFLATASTLGYINFQKDKLIAMV